jgi:uncharacterized protein (DUF433 family)
MNGKPCIRGMRITVSTVLNLLANGMTKEAIIADYPYLEPEDIGQCLIYCEQSSQKLSDKFAGKLPPDAAKKLQDHIKQSRDEWDMQQTETLLKPPALAPFIFFPFLLQLSKKFFRSRSAKKRPCFFYNLFLRFCFGFSSLPFLLKELRATL